MNNRIDLKIQLIDSQLPMPDYQTSGAVAFDLYSRIDLEIEPSSLLLVPANIIVKIPENHFLMIVPRSSAAKKKNLFIPIGIIDQDYCGENDEIKIQAYNFSTQKVNIEKGERIAQGILVNFSQANFILSKMDNVSRQGFGSTGQF